MSKITDDFIKAFNEYKVLGEEREAAKQKRINDALEKINPITLIKLKKLYDEEKKLKLEVQELHQRTNEVYFSLMTGEFIDAASKVTKTAFDDQAILDKWLETKGIKREL